MHLLFPGSAMLGLFPVFSDQADCLKINFCQLQHSQAPMMVLD